MSAEHLPRKLALMETTELTSEGAVIVFNKYDLDVLRHVLQEVALRVDPADFESRTGAPFREVKSMADKVSRTYQSVMNS